jgi:hypothetical protein
MESNNLKSPPGTETIPLIASSYTLATAVMSFLVVFAVMPLRPEIRSSLAPLWYFLVE